LYTGVDDIPGWQINESTPEPFNRRTISLFDMIVISLEVPYAFMSLIDACSPLKAPSTTIACCFMKDRDKSNKAADSKRSHKTTFTHVCLCDQSTHVNRRLDSQLQ